MDQAYEAFRLTPTSLRGLTLVSLLFWGSLDGSIGVAAAGPMVYCEHSVPFNELLVSSSN